MANAACRNHPALFQAIFDEPKPKRVRAAKRICDTCPVTEECLQFLAQLPRSQQNFGVWGGKSPLDREAPETVAS